MNISKATLLLFSFSTLLFSCTRTPGEGGRASITGHVDKIRRVQINNPASTVDTIAASDEEVFIVYGDNISPNDRVFTNPDGDFAFNWLRTGDYTLYVYSEDTVITSQPLPRIAIQASVNIDDRDEVVEVGTITIFDEF